MKVPEVLAIYGAALSTIVFAWNVSRALPRFKVDLVLALDDIDGEPVTGVNVSVRNPSSSTVHLAAISVLYRSSHPTFRDFVEHIWRFRRVPRTLGWVHVSPNDFGANTSCPCEIAPGSAHNVLITDDVLCKILERAETYEMAAVAQDQLARDRYASAISVSWLDSSEQWADRVSDD